MFIKPVNDFSGEKQDEVQLGYLSLANSNSIGHYFFTPVGGLLYLILHQLIRIKVKVALIYKLFTIYSISYVITFQ